MPILHSYLLGRIVVVAIMAFLSAIAQSQDLESGLSDIAVQLSEPMSGKVKKIAVVEFPDLNGYQSSLGKFIAEELISRFTTANTYQFDVVERSQLSKVLKEQELTGSVLFDDDSIAKLGRILGIEAIITGSITDLGTDIKINARAISVETAKIFSSSSSKVKKNDTIKQLMLQNYHSTQSLSAAGALSAPAAAGHKIQRSDVFFQNDFLRVEVPNIAVSKNKKRVTLSLIFQNLLSENLLIALEAYYCCSCSAGITDSRGDTIHDTKLVTGLPCLSEYDGKKPEKYTKIGPGSKTTVVLSFEKRKETFEGKVFSFSSNLMRFERNGASKFTVGIFGIEI